MGGRSDPIDGKLLVETEGGRAVQHQPFQLSLGRVTSQVQMDTVLDDLLLWHQLEEDPRLVLLSRRQIAHGNGAARRKAGRFSFARVSSKLVRHLNARLTRCV